MLRRFALLCSFAAHAPISLDTSSLLNHFKRELRLARLHWRLLLCGLVFQWVHSVAHNVAYMMHTPRQPLDDLGFTLIPPMPPGMQIVSEILFFLLFFSTVCYVLFAPLILQQHGFYCVLILVRYFRVLVLAQILRICCFLVTSLPGPNYHCLPGAKNYNPPHSFREVFYRQDAFFGCGDLVFSSHTIFATLNALIIGHYSTWRPLRRVLVVVVVVFGLLVVAARKHYSVDIVIAWYTVLLLWVAVLRYYPDTVPIDFEEPLSALFQVPRSQTEKGTHPLTDSGICIPISPNTSLSAAAPSTSRIRASGASTVAVVTSQTDAL